MRIFFALVLMSTQSAFSTTVQVYDNDAKSLQRYISQDEFSIFYDTLLCLNEKDQERFLAMSHRRDGLQESEFSLVEFYVRSPEITPAIPGYMAVYVEGSDSGNANGVGLVAYIPSKICREMLHQKSEVERVLRQARTFFLGTLAVAFAFEIGPLELVEQLQGPLL